MRKLLLPGIVIIAGILITARLFYLQIIDDTFKLKSENISIKIKYDYPERGYIYDRNGALMVANQPSYDIMVIPRETKSMDTIEFCNLLNITKTDFIKKIQKAVVYSPMLPSVFLGQLNKLEYAAFQEKERKFEGFYIQKRSLREYQLTAGANVFGFITQANEAMVKQNPYYKSGDLLGKQGVEETYEAELRGTKGVKHIQRDRFNREIGPYKEGKYDTIAKQGKDITLTIDAELQKYGEALMKNKRGGIIAIEPSTGEILCLVTAPSYDPAILVGRQRSRNYTKLYNDSLAKPLYDRSLLAEYPPGSPFKILTALAGLQAKVIDTSSSFICNRGFSYGRGRFMGCHCGGGVRKLHMGIAKSCNTYFANTYLRTIAKFPTPTAGVDFWSHNIKSFGLGQFMGYDLPTGRKGKIPTSETYKKMYPNGGWRGTAVISNSIGQGEVLMTPIQLANMMATVANQGYYYTPHIIKKIKGQQIDPKFRTKHVTSIDKKYFKPVINGLAEVFKTGTAYFLKVDGIEICGKTGTADNFARVNGKKVMLKPHSVFVAFAPKVNPKIAIAVLVENGGFGSTVAGPITTLMLEKYIKKEITMKDREKRVLETSLQGEYNRFTRKYLDSMYKIKIRKDSILRTINTKKLDSIKKSKPTT
ncbi:penicillin-binding protein 2 [Flavobacterium psychrophilum]|uniref:penicillin-binding protein 2 n=1 Tax=Flavobacterium psychrophilum TaxID=96345 RepID=UPI0006187CB8|nr:penicillin-binding protein 2 [Flavobacterium psychrophilum]EKT3956958.1 penicillin-binding protein 2 [Flavobacterium psychrophilum]EKT3964107.1 penicillin-binding protein 2 [Flavobacterium psychrophilum]EKT4498489.1 penicillin-binding protein 2 [Flavobacterium psychrophilum]EKT4501795.1 penicillin-binding protein 2 [Flavobacterium psychrophilum]EKT4509098.1 penicillin-binding protein 2 [Flavobacterium psychrophilum]